MLLMIVLGASDSMRGVFGQVFVDHFEIGTVGFAQIVTVSYIGNLLFMLFGSRLADVYGIKNVFCTLLILLLVAFMLYLVTDSYLVLLIGMFIAMGTSTLMNTLINVMTPLLFVSAPALIVNTLYFVQGIGTSGNQYISGRHASSFLEWKYACLVLFVLGVIAFILFCFLQIPKTDTNDDESKIRSSFESENTGYGLVIRNPWFFVLVLLFGFYFVAEHSIMNWLVLFCSSQYQYTTEKSSFYLSLFFGGITIGRLIFAPIVHKIGIAKSLILFTTVGACLYTFGILGADFHGCWLFPNSLLDTYLLILGCSGLALSIVYPTMVMYISGFYNNSILSTATGTIISSATVFDIAFNALFGPVVSEVGFTGPMLVLPVCMVLFLGMLLYSRRGYHGNR
ncbi:MAG: MFS transporter [Treponema sp.]|nr:MFS transporter [Treponema sp.]